MASKHLGPTVPPQPVNNNANVSYSSKDDHSIHYEDNDYSVKIITQGKYTKWRKGYLTIAVFLLKTSAGQEWSWNGALKNPVDF